jgi:hypothetical protein
MTPLSQFNGPNIGMSSQDFSKGRGLFSLLIALRLQKVKSKQLFGTLPFH